MVWAGWLPSFILYLYTTPVSGKCCNSIFSRFHNDHRIGLITTFIVPSLSSSSFVWRNKAPCIFDRSRRTRPGPTTRTEAQRARRKKRNNDMLSNPKLIQDRRESRVHFCYSEERRETKARLSLWHQSETEARRACVCFELITQLPQGIRSGKGTDQL